jgi:hypothetical protein
VPDLADEEGAKGLAAVKIHTRDLLALNGRDSAQDNVYIGQNESEYDPDR